MSPDSKVCGANMGPTWVLSAPDGPHVGPMNLAIREFIISYSIGPYQSCWCPASLWLVKLFPHLPGANELTQIPHIWSLTCWYEVSLDLFRLRDLFAAACDFFVGRYRGGPCPIRLLSMVVMETLSVSIRCCKVKFVLLEYFRSWLASRLAVR